MVDIDRVGRKRPPPIALDPFEMVRLVGLNKSIKVKIAIVDAKSEIFSSFFGFKISKQKSWSVNPLKTVL